MPSSPSAQRTRARELAAPFEDNAREVLAIRDEYGSIRGYLASFPDAGAAAADMRRRFKFLGDTRVWRLLTSASRDVG
jgi:3-methyladenine DNA glycosylase Tag